MNAAGRVFSAILFPMANSHKPNMRVISESGNSLWQASMIFSTSLPICANSLFFFLFIVLVNWLYSFYWLYWLCWFNWLYSFKWFYWFNWLCWLTKSTNSTNPTNKTSQVKPDIFVSVKGKPDNFLSNHL